ncbi:cytochrome-c peroxidase [Silvimonas iriomotensis]|uniref:Cytochrome-c peroxidase n=1 Tax=Silvimonas iriomotensis TaxID=449662 RepID=A0ABQ2PCW9_9NEIS|nr:cytochrome c peroxidase [Silvimonas iriomotensis]GGP23208.1 cytochrome-c peroxidase [Silvimonas iriomotensis]
MQHLIRIAVCLLPIVLAACGGGSDNATTTTSAPTTTPTPAPSAATASAPLSLSAQVGHKLFFDATLSGSGKMSCATCHDPNFAYAAPNNLAVQLGGTDLLQAGTRAVPSLRYKEFTPAYADLLDNPDGVSVPGPGGGFTWDGRSPTLADQSSIPLLSANEMANASPADVVAKVKAAAYAPLFLQAFGNDAFTDTSKAFANIQAALQAYQMEDQSFHPFSSKFDLYVANKIGGNMTAAELRGLTVFTDANSGNCASCHYQGAGLNGSSALFTDFSYETISVPRNMDIPANQNAAYYDMGVCGPLRTDHLPASPGAANSFCGLFKAPTLRNVSLRGAFFHNGVIHSLYQLVHFYNTRDTNPEIWYPTVGGTPKATPDANFPTYGLITTQYTGGTVQKFNDLPAAYVGNIDPQMPLDSRAPGATPPMTEAQMSDLICFLNTLTDGYQAPANPPAHGTCVD